MIEILAVSITSLVGILIAVLAKRVVAGLSGVAGFFSPTDESLTNL